MLVSDEVREYLALLDEKSQRICKRHLQVLANYPYPGRGPGDKEHIGYRGREAWRLHVGRTHTAFYRIDEDSNVVRVLDLMPIDDAHKMYE